VSHASTIFVKMEPSDIDQFMGADLGLSISNESLAILQDHID
jgi:hypothetical protein